MTPEATVGVLLYGDFPDLAERCLGPLWPLHRSGLIQLRIGCNQCSLATLKYVHANHDAATHVVASSHNKHKYPMMRTLISTAPMAPKFMWFDDDSYIDGDPNEVIKTALALCEARTMVGQVWHMKLGGNQHLYIRDQPYYTGKPVHRGHSVKFCQGAWWVIPSSILLRHDWPPLELERKGGDVMLGELCRQQDIVLRDVGKEFGIRINADKEGRHSKSLTRGPLPIPKPLGWDYQPGASARVLDTVGDAPQL